MRRRTFGQGRGIILKPNEISINQKEDTEVLYHDVQDVINSVKQGVHRYHAKQEGDVLYATQLDDTNSARYVDGQTAKVSNVDMGDTFSYIPGFYATLMLQKKDIWVYRFSKEPVNEDSFFFGDVFIGSYGGDFTNGNINSLSHPDTSTGTNKTRDQLEQMASSKGKGYLLTDLSMHNLVGLLYVAIHHNTDCKGTLGSGADTADRPCGSSTSYGITESKPGDIFTSFLGIENWWGGRYEVVGRLNANVGKIDGIYHVVEEDGSARKIQSLAPLSQWLYPRKMILGKRFDIVADPSCYQGEITAGHGWNSEQYMRNEADRVVIRGGYQADISSGFAFLAARFTNTESGSFSTITGRLAYKGKYKFVDTDEYRQMFDPNYAPPVQPEIYDVKNAPDGVYIYTAQNQLMNKKAYQDSDKTINDVCGIAILNGNYRFVIDPRIYQKSVMNTGLVPSPPEPYGVQDTECGYPRIHRAYRIRNWTPERSPATWFALNSIFKHGEHGYVPSVGEAREIRENLEEVREIATLLGFDIPGNVLWTCTFPDSFSQGYVYGIYLTGAYYGTLKTGGTNTCLPVSKLMEKERDYFVRKKRDTKIEGQTESITQTKHGIMEWVAENSHRYLCKYINGVMNICQLDDNNSNIFHDGTPAILTGEQGDVMMMIPKFYVYTRQIAKTYNNMFGYMQKEYEDGAIEYGGDLIGVYQSTLQNGVLRSISGASPASGYSKNEFQSYARARNSKQPENEWDGFNLIKQRHCDMLALMFILKYNRFDWDEVIGNGVYSEKTITGITNKSGMSDGAVSGHVNFWGLEDFWGNGYEYIGNVRYGDKSVSSLLTYYVYGDYPDNDGKLMLDARSVEKNKLSFSFNNNEHGNTTVSKVDNNEFTIYLNSGYFTETPCGMKYQYMFSDQFDMAAARSGCNDGNGNGYGLAYLNTMFGLNQKGDHRNRARITFKGDINIIDNVQHFLNL